MFQLTNARSAVLAVVILGATLPTHAQDRIVIDSTSFIPMDLEQTHLSTAIQGITSRRTGPMPLTNYALTDFKEVGFPNRYVQMVALSKSLFAKLSVSSSFIQYDDKSYLGYFHAYEYWPELVRVKVAGSDVEHNAVAYWGRGCRLQFVMKTTDASAGIGMGSVGLDAKYKQSMESANFKAMGYESFVPFTLDADEDGKVNFVEGRKNLIKCFNEYQASSGSKGIVLLGLDLSKEALSALSAR